MTEEFEQLYRDYFQFIYLYALSLTRDEDLAEEITQETFFRAMEHIDRFEGREKPLPLPLPGLQAVRC